MRMQRRKEKIRKGVKILSGGLERLATGIGKAIETVPELYEDAFQPVVQESGKILARIPSAINAAFSGLDKWILNREYNIEETKKILAKKLEDIEPEKIVEPEPYVALPALQAISYSMNSTELQNLYANLLARAMNSDTKDKVHPAYVEIIKQLSPVDAAIFKELYWTGQQPLIDLSILKETGGQIFSVRNISWLTSFAPEFVGVSLDNLIRLGLIEIPFGESYTNDQVYDKVRATDYYMEIKSELEKKNLGKINEGKKLINITRLAIAFYEVCIQE